MQMSSAKLSGDLTNKISECPILYYYAGFINCHDFHYWLDVLFESRKLSI